MESSAAAKSKNTHECGNNLCVFFKKKYSLYKAAYRPAGAPNQAEDGGGEDEQGEDDLPGLHLFLIHCPI